MSCAGRVSYLRGAGIHNSMTDKYKVAIIGAGRIGAGFDVPSSKNILTHAHAFSANARTRLVAFVDTDPKQAEKAANKWSTSAFTNVAEMFSSVHPDIVVIASPEDTHVPLLSEVGKLAPRLIVCEKPVTTSQDEFDGIRTLSSVPVIVNFRRRFDATMQQLQKDIGGGKFGPVISASAIYSKGLLHNGTHVIDLARFLFGEMQTSTTLSSINDWEGGPTIGAYLSFEKCPRFHLMHGDERAYSVFELDILTEKKRFRFFDEGFVLSTQDVTDDPVYAGFKVLGEAKTEKTDLINAMARLAEHAVNVLDGKELPRSDLDNALKTERACFHIVSG